MQNRVDPYVVALAKSETSLINECIVVCKETMISRPNRNPPVACKHFGVKSINVTKMLAREFPNEEWE